MDSKDVERLLAVLESRRVAASVVGAVVIVTTAVAVARADLLAAVGQVPALGSPIVVTVLLIAALACGYSLTLLLLGGAEAIGRYLLRVARRRQERDRVEAERRDANAKREDARRAKAEQLRRALPHLSPGAHETLRDLLRAGADGLALKHDDKTLANLSDLGFVARQAPLDGARSIYTITPAARPVVEPFLVAQREAQIRSALEGISPEAASLLGLFALPDPTPGEPAHPWIESAVYNAAYHLERAKILTREAGKARPTSRNAGRGAEATRCDERLVLAADAVPLVEQLVLRRAVLRTVVALDWSQIASSVASGGGAMPMSAGISYPVQRGSSR